MDISKGISPRILFLKVEFSLIAFYYRKYVRKDRFWIFEIENNLFKTKKWKF